MRSYRLWKDGSNQSCSVWIGLCCSAFKEVGLCIRGEGEQVGHEPDKICVHREPEGKTCYIFEAHYYLSILTNDLRACVYARACVRAC